MNQEGIWQTIKSNIKDKNANNKPLQMWFEPTKLIKVTSDDNVNRFQIGVPTELHKYWISQNLLELISQELSQNTQAPFEVELVVTGEIEKPETIAEKIQKRVEKTTVAPKNALEQQIQTRNYSQSKKGYYSLHPDYTFSTFVVGRNNEFAHAASFNISKNPGKDSYNPLFIYGPTGMGKTHLLNAVGNEIKRSHPDFTVSYLSAEKFLNECVSSIRRNEMDKFRKKYRQNSNVLLIDDIQVLGRGEAVQEEFFHTLNHFFDINQQVIVASDRMPKDIKGLEDRIRTRLEWGLIADIQMPDIETRVAILKYKAEKKNLRIPTDVVTYIGRISKRSIRELEGNLNKVQMFSELQNLDITLDMAKKVLSAHDETVTITINEIQKICADHFKVRVKDLCSKSRTKPLVTARQVAMTLIKKHLDKSLVEIGRAFGGKDHTTVMNALRRVADQQTKNLDLKRDIEEIEHKIHNITGV